MLQTTKTVLKKIGAVCCILLGIVGLFLPFLQGILLILLGLVMLGVIEKKDIERWLERLRLRRKK